MPPLHLARVRHCNPRTEHCSTSNCPVWWSFLADTSDLEG